MGELMLSIIEQQIQALIKAEGEHFSRRVQLERERDEYLRIMSAPASAPAKATPKLKGKTTGIRSRGSLTVKEQILSHMRDHGAATRSQLAEATGVKATTINGTLHALKKAGEVMSTPNGWAIASSDGPNGSEEPGVWGNPT